MRWSSFPRPCAPNPQVSSKTAAKPKATHRQSKLIIRIDASSPRARKSKLAHYLTPELVCE
jgi:hypothetical protein